MNINAFSFLVIFSLFIIWPVHSIELPPHNFQKTPSVSNEQCISCHQSSQTDWQRSDHAKSMAIPDKSSVLADFDNTTIEHYGQNAHFFIKDNRYQVTISFGNSGSTYPIKYTFGHFPLQQYLVETQKGKLQVLPFAWDSRDKMQGGQRWYHNYSHEEISPEDRLHWRQPLQNWNGMCADCHSDGLVRNYNLEKNSFSSQYDNINVGCLSCHGDMNEHALKKKSGKNITKDKTVKTSSTGQWVRSLGKKTAHWQGEKRDNSIMDKCFSCHALRTPITDGIRPRTPFLNQFTPQLLTAPNYHVDGQIKEEVYVYGSFLQSKMHAKGVNCLDCHDKHTTKLKIEGNGLCLQCHDTEAYNTMSHHQHQETSIGAQCVNCHMPTNRYMGVDDRRDHSFKIPRPDISQQYNTPNACIACHSNKSDLWASNYLLKWHGKPQKQLLSKQLLMKLQSGQKLTLQQHISIISDNKLDVISRATAIQLLPYTSSSLSYKILSPYLLHSEPLLRLSSAIAATNMPIGNKAKYLTPLLNDKYKSVRIAAARSLITSDLSFVDKPLFNKALKELISANIINTWRGDGLINQGVLANEMNNPLEAERLLNKSIEIDPYFVESYVNLADIYRAQQRPARVASVLSKAIKNNPESAVLYYAYGLHYVRQQHLTKALVKFENAMKLDANNAQYAYTYILAVEGTDSSAQALIALKKLILNYQNKIQLRDQGLHLSQKLQNQADYNWFIKIK